MNSFLRIFFTTGLLPLILAVGGLVAFLQKAEARDDFEFSGVDRIVAIGDLHGDFNAYQEVMAEAGLRDKDGNWIGGKTHLVQTGDVLDRGPDGKKIYDDLFRLAKKARKAGGRIHLLIGNHEMMNMLGDLRYVPAEEYAAFAGRDSEKKLKAFFDSLVARGFFKAEIEEQGLPEEEVFQEWRKTHPPGFVEQREAWAAGGPYYKKVIELPSLIRINDTLFTHAGISWKFCHLSIAEFNDLVRQAIKKNDQAAFDLLFSETGPLWYRGYADNGEEELPLIDAVLEAHNAGRIVVGHTPTGGVVLPRFDGKVIIDDVGLADYYGASRGFLLYEDGVWYGVQWGKKIPLPKPGTENLIAYLGEVAALSPHPKYINQLIEKLKTPVEAEAVN